MKKQIDLVIWHEDCWMLELTRDHPSVELVVDDICSNGRDILARVTVNGADGDELDGLVEEYTAHGAIRALDVLERDERSLILHTRYDIGNSIYDTIIESSLTPIREIRIHDDQEEWTLISDASAVGAAIGELEKDCRIKVDRVTDFQPVDRSSTTVLEGIEDALSERQNEYLFSALEEGYYTWPRNVSAKELAKKHGVAGPTALEHLRKGEAIILCEILDELADADHERLRPDASR